MGAQKKKPTKEQLIVDILEANTREDIAIKYNVSLSTVKRWFVYYKISFSDVKYKEREKKVLELYQSCNNNSDIAKSSNISVYNSGKRWIFVLFQHILRIFVSQRKRY